MNTPIHILDKTNNLNRYKSNDSVRDIDREFINNLIHKEGLKLKLNQTSNGTEKMSMYKPLDRKPIRENKKQILEMMRDLLKPTSKQTGEYGSDVRESFMSFLSNALEHIDFLKKKKFLQGRYVDMIKEENEYKQNKKQKYTSQQNTSNEGLIKREMNDLMVNEMYTKTKKSEKTTIPDMIPLISRTSDIGKKKTENTAYPQQIKYD